MIVHSDRYMWAQMSWDDFSRWGRAFKLSGAHKTRKLLGCLEARERVFLVSFSISNLTKKLLCRDEMHPAVEASLGKDKQSDGKTLEDVMRRTDTKKWHVFLITVKTGRCDGYCTASITLCFTSYQQRETERAHPTSTLTLSLTLSCVFHLPTYDTLVGGCIFSLQTAQNRKDPTGIYETPNVRCLTIIRLELNIITIIY